MDVRKSLKDASMRRPKRRRSAADDDEPSKEEIMEDIRVGMQKAAAGY